MHVGVDAAEDEGGLLLLVGDGVEGLAPETPRTPDRLAFIGRRDFEAEAGLLGGPGSDLRVLEEDNCLVVVLCGGG